MKFLSRRLILLLIAAIFLSGAPSAAHAQDGPPQDAGGPGQGMGQIGGMGMAGGAEHSVRGSVTAVSGNQITVKTEEGDVYQVATGPNTRFRKSRDQIKISDIHIGDMVAAAGDKDEKARTIGAMFVMVIDKEQYEKARAEFGKTWTAGTIQSIDETRITVKRPDNVTQTIVVDENTSFRKRRDSITLGDIKVGDNVSARGALQGGNFLATVLSVGGLGGEFRGGPRNRPQGAPGQTPGQAPNAAAPASNPNQAPENN